MYNSCQPVRSPRSGFRIISSGQKLLSPGKNNPFQVIESRGRGLYGKLGTLYPGFFRLNFQLDFQFFKATGD